ncbi:MAG TPA: 5-formyltetrahydrofolate cyclo-ligase [Phycisphaerales bacterium]|nr:5-formyltetrahydrofolate cyclo-ligase [Phycisphaerales bacterium]
MTPKAELRKRHLVWVGGTTPSQRAEWSAAIARRVIEAEEFGGAGVVMTYLPMAGEPDVIAINQEVLRRGMRLCVPRCDWDCGRILAVGIGEAMPLKLVRSRGVMEPAEGDEIDPAAIGVVIVPGVVFDANGGRLGRGAGFYDRFLLAWRAARGKGVGGAGNGRRSGCAIGVAFEGQIAAEVPMEEGDCRVDAVATEARLVRVPFQTGM